MKPCRSCGRRAPLAMGRTQRHIPRSISVSLALLAWLLLKLPAFDNVSSRHARQGHLLCPRPPRAAMPLVPSLLAGLGGGCLKASSTPYHRQLLIRDARGGWHCCHSLHHISCIYQEAGLAGPAILQPDTRPRPLGLAPKPPARVSPLQPPPTTPAKGPRRPRSHPSMHSAVAACFPSKKSVTAWR